MKKLTPVLVFILLAGLCSAQSSNTVMTSAGTANLPAQSIGVNDLIAVSVYRSPELTRTVRVDSSGGIILPLMKEPVHAAGLMPSQLEDSVAGALKREGVLVNPVVEVTVAEYASRPISVMGAVKKPLTFQAVGRVTLMDALARAEGFAPGAAQEILVTIPDAGADGQSLVRRIPVKSLIDDADPELNLMLEGGEEIRVPESGRIFVVGNVSKPGAYPVPDPKDATVLKMLAMAEGLAPFAGKRAYIYREEPESAVQREVEIELAQIMKRKIPDITLQVNDVLYIPDNTGRRKVMTIIDRAVGFGATTASGILVWRR